MKHVSRFEPVSFFTIVFFGFFPSWITVMCLFKWSFLLKFLPHKVHFFKFCVSISENNSLLVWTNTTWLFKRSFREKIWSQKTHFNFFSSWIDAICLFRFSLREKILLQKVHTFSLFSSSFDFIKDLIFYFIVNTFQL